MIETWLCVDASLSTNWTDEEFAGYREDGEVWYTFYQHGDRLRWKGGTGECVVGKSYELTVSQTTTTRTDTAYKVESVRAVSRD